MQMFYKRNGSLVEYKIVTDPEEAMYWTTHRLKKSEIKILTQCDRATAAQIRQEILDDILSREPNPSKKRAPASNQVSQERKVTTFANVKKRKSQQKTR